MRHREVEWLAQGHSASHWQNQNLHSGSLGDISDQGSLGWAPGDPGQKFAGRLRGDTHPSAFLPSLHLRRARGGQRPGHLAADEEEKG